MRWLTRILFFFPLITFGQGHFSPAAGQAGSTAIKADSSLISGWISNCNIHRGFLDYAQPNLGFASHGDSSATLGMADNNVVSLGDSGYAEIIFNPPLSNQPGYEFAIFENSFSDNYLELAFVEVSSNGIDFIRFPAVCLTADSAQLGSFGSSDPTNIHNLAGKYRGNFGTPFDLEDLKDSTHLDLNLITHLRIVDVIGAINQTFTSFDSQGNQINDPYPTNFASGGFDLDAVALLHPQNIGLKEHKTKARVYPNPSHGKIYIDDAVSEFSLINLNGEKLKSGTEIPQEIQLSPGIYLLQYTTKNQKHFAEKLLVR